MKRLKQVLFVIFALLAARETCFSQFLVGDTTSFWSVTYIDWPPLQGSPQRRVNATCQRSGQHCYLFVENTAALPTQADMDSLISRFDNHWYDSLTTAYGPVPNVYDNDQKIFILVFNESDWWGYFDPGQQMADTMVFNRWNRHSSQREIIYVASSASANFDDVVPHELGHMLHWQQDHSPEPLVNPTKYWEDTWVDEGFSTFAAIYLTENIFMQNVQDGGSFFASNPDIPLIYFSDYNQVKLFMLFMFEHYGHWDYIHTLIGNQLNGIAGVNNTLSQLGYSQTFDDVFEQWVIANYIDDMQYEGGKYGYAHYNFPACAINATHATFPTNVQNKTVTPYGADYIVFTATTPKPIVVDFAGQPDSKYRVSLILTTNAAVDTVISIPLDGSNHAQFSIDSLGTTFTQAIMVVMNVDSAITEGSSTSYTYSAILKTGVESQEINHQVSIFPNPAKDKLYIVASTTRESTIEIQDMQGRLQYQSTFENNATIDLNTFAKGVYFVRIKNDLGSTDEKIIVY